MEEWIHADFELEDGSVDVCWRMVALLLSTMALHPEQTNTWAKQTPDVHMAAAMLS